MPLPTVRALPPPGEKAKANRADLRVDPPCDRVMKRAKIGRLMAAARMGRIVHSGMTDPAPLPSCTQKITPLDGVAVLGFPARPPVLRSNTTDDKG